MKFAKELEHEAVPEWRVKYLNYKAGKKHIKAVSRAIAKTHGTPRVVAPRVGDRLPTRGTWNSTISQLPPRSQPQTVAGRQLHAQAPPIRTERQSLTRQAADDGNYGSFVPTPPGPTALVQMDSRTNFELPAPAMRVSTRNSDHPPRPSDSLRRESLQRSVSESYPEHEGPQPATRPRQGTFSSVVDSPNKLRRLFSHGQQLSRTETTKMGYGMKELDTVRQREREFFEFLDEELDKVESFYRFKEEQAGQRLAALREQLHEMRNRRTEELAEMKRRKEHEDARGQHGEGTTSGFDGGQRWMDPIKAKILKPGANSKALSKMPFSPVFGPRSADAKRDYVKKPHEHHVPYRTAKRKLKLALQEFYRGLELLKSYALLNRTAFRKLNKKYDKAVNARPPYRYMNEKVNKAWFVNSDVIDGHITAVEDLYARYFEKGNHKVAAGKLRRVNRRVGDESGIAFRNGLFIGIGAVFTVQGLVSGAQLLFDDDPVLRQQTSFLLQIYAGYFLMLYLLSLFCIDCYFWTSNKINYPFIFEFDPRHSLDWRQLASFPSFFLLLFGVFFWLNFTRLGNTEELYLYYPVILIGITLVIILLPAPVLWHQSRKWFAYSHWRLFFAGLYPVEFRDFFLGDIYCSLSYATANVELFFCLYARSWENPKYCNSSHSRLMGFLATLPAVWRALQCIRRYRDTRNVFPHLVNCGKYGMTIMSNVMLSLYRINGTTSNLALFITFSTINGIYTSIWDLFMDFSLLQPDSRNPYLRNILGLKKRWVYYCIMVIDPILRFSWIFYAIFTHDKQHSTFVSFLVALAEATRRGIWALLRVENEHCSNVSQYKASRDVPLPYHLEQQPLVGRESPEEDEESSEEALASAVDRVGASQRSRDQTRAGEPPQTQPPTGQEESGIRRRRKPELARARSIRGIMADAHREDFVKKKRPTDIPDEDEERAMEEIRSDEEDDEDDSGSNLDESMELRQAKALAGGKGSVKDVE